MSSIYRPQVSSCRFRTRTKRRLCTATFMADTNEHRANTACNHRRRPPTHSSSIRRFWNYQLSRSAVIVSSANVAFSSLFPFLRGKYKRTTKPARFSRRAHVAATTANFARIDRLKHQTTAVRRSVKNESLYTDWSSLTFQKRRAVRLPRRTKRSERSVILASDNMCI